MFSVADFSDFEGFMATVPTKSGLRTELLDMSIHLLATSTAQRPWHTSHTMTHEHTVCYEQCNN